MTALKYPGYVREAGKLSQFERELAEAVYRETGIGEQLADVAAEIQRETGETYSVATLAGYLAIGAGLAEEGQR